MRQLQTLRRLCLTGLLAGLCLLAPRPLRAADAEAPKPGKQAPQSFETKVGINYLLYLPADYGKEKDKKWPLMLFLHGAGERGTDVQLVAKHGPPKLVAEGKELPFIIVSPQVAPGEGWDSPTLKKLLDDVRAKYSVDSNRLYLTGLSMGGYGTWEMATRYPDLFAAIAPICGGGDPSRARRIAKLPIWVFHGEDDKTVPIAQSERMVEALKTAGATDVQFTRYPNTGHDSWVKAYNDPKLFEWFLSHEKGGAGAAAKEGK